MYILPLAAIIVYTYAYHSGSSLDTKSRTKAIGRLALFSTWISRTLNDQTEGVSLIFSGILHLLIVTFLMLLAMIASFIRSEEKNISQIREAHKQETKTGLELNQLAIKDQTMSSQEDQNTTEEQSKLISK